jgi:hypothetical protein
MKGIIVGLVKDQLRLPWKLIEGLAGNGFCQLGASDILHLTKGACSFKVNHITFVAKPSLEKVKYLLLDADGANLSL